jgi:hypothetical protein
MTGNHDIKQEGDTRSSGGTPKKEPKDMSKVKCYKCGKKGHESQYFPENEAVEISRIWIWKDEEEIEAAMYCTAYNMQTIREAVIDKAVNTMIKLGRWTVDSAA